MKQHIPLNWTAVRCIHINSVVILSFYYLILSLQFCCSETSLAPQSTLSFKTAFHFFTVNISSTWNNIKVLINNLLLIQELQQGLNLRPCHLLADVIVWYHMTHSWVTAAEYFTDTEQTRIVESAFKDWSIVPESPVSTEPLVAEAFTACVPGASCTLSTAATELKKKFRETIFLFP